MDSMKHYSTYQSQFIEMFGQVSEESPCLNDIARVYDGTHKTPTYTDSGIPFISVENITDIYSSQKYISREDYELYKHKPEHGDIFMTRIGSIGKCAVYESFDPLAYYVSLALIKPNKDMVHPKFLKYYIESSDGAFELRKRSLLKAFPMKINLGEIGKIKVIVPAKDKQLEFVKIAEQADKSKFTSLKSQFIEMFGDPNKGNWTASVADYCYILGGFAFKSDLFSSTGVPIVRISNINDGVVDIDQSINYGYDFWVSNPSYRVLDGDILMAMSGATTGKVGVFRQNVPALLNQRVACIRQKEGKSVSSFLYAALQSEFMYKTIQSSAQGGAQPNISSKQISKLPMPAANILDQKKFESIAQQADKSKYIN